jgi:hypothetical protein
MTQLRATTLTQNGATNTNSTTQPSHLEALLEMKTSKSWEALENNVKGYAILVRRRTMHRRRTMAAGA